MNHEFYHGDTSNVLTDMCPPSFHEGVAGIAANDCRATVVDVVGGVQMYTARVHGTADDELPACAAPTRRLSLRSLQLMRLLTETGGASDCCGTDAVCMPLASHCNVLAPPVN